MTGFQILDCDIAADRSEWLRRWNAWPEREPMAHPAYVKLFARECDRAVCAVFGTDADGVLYPLLLRPLWREEWTGPAEGRWDATSPYGYGGPFAWGTAAQDARAFWIAMTEWLRRQRVVASFTRLSLFQEGLLPFEGQVSERMPNVVCDLERADAETWRNYAHKVRKNVSTARRANLSVEMDDSGQHLDAFMDIYESTMDRRQAAKGYYFSRAFFESIVTDMRGSFLFAHVLSGAKVISTELVLRSAQHLYSFLGGTRAEAFALRPNDLLKHSVIEWGHEAGLKHYVLGGGYEAADGIFRYKLAFSPSGEVPFSIGTAIHDPDAYATLMQTRTAFELTRGLKWSPRSGYFPGYRA